MTTGSDNKLQIINPSTPITNTPLSINDGSNTCSIGSGSSGSPTINTSDFVTLDTTQAISGAKIFTVPINIAPAITATEAVTLAQLQAATSTGSYINNQNTLAQVGANFWIDGSATVGSLSSAISALGIATATSPSLNDNSTNVATTAWVQSTLLADAIYFDSSIFDGTTLVSSPLSLIPNLFINNQSASAQPASYWISGTAQIDGTDTISTNWSGLTISKNILLNANNLVGALLTLSGSVGPTGGATGTIGLALNSPTGLDSILGGSLFVNGKVITNGLQINYPSLSPSPPYFFTYYNHTGTPIGKIFDATSDFTWGSTSDLGTTFGVDGSFSTTGAITFTGLSSGTPAGNTYLTLDSGNNVVLAAGGGGGGVNIYNTDGTLTGNRTINTSTYALYFSSGTGTSIYMQPGINNLNVDSYTAYQSSSNNINILAGTSSTAQAQVVLSDGGAKLNYVGSSSINLWLAPTASGGNLFVDALNNTGLKYGADYSSNFTARSLIDKGYADATYVNIATPVLTTSSTVGYLWTATDTAGGGSWQVNAGNIIAKGKVFPVTTTGTVYTYTAPHTTTLLNMFRVNVSMYENSGTGTQTVFVTYYDGVLTTHTLSIDSVASVGPSVGGSILIFALVATGGVSYPITITNTVSGTVSTDIAYSIEQLT